MIPTLNFNFLKFPFRFNLPAQYSAPQFFVVSAQVVVQNYQANLQTHLTSIKFKYAPLLKAHLNSLISKPMTPSQNQTAKFTIEFLKFITLWY